MADNTLQVGARVRVFMTGVPVEWFQKAQIQAVSNSQEIITEQGYSGESPGTPMVTIAVDGAVPKSAANAGQLWNMIEEASFAPLQANVGALKYAATGKVVDLSVTGGTNEVTTFSFNWRGPLKRVDY